MQLKPEEISKVIRSQIKYYDNAIQQNETGTVLMVGDGIARASVPFPDIKQVVDALGYLVF